MRGKGTEDKAAKQSRKGQRPQSARSHCGGLEVGGICSLHRYLKEGGARRKKGKRGWWCGGGMVCGVVGVRARDKGVQKGARDERKGKATKA